MQWSLVLPACGRRSEPATSPQLQDGQPLGRRVVRSALGWDAFHPGILDAHLLLNKEELLGEPGDPSSAVISGIGLSAGSGQGESGQRDGVDSRRTDTARPVLGKWQGRNGLFGHESPL